ncbi:MAG: glycosyltransferase [Candidatus Omnitrophica bacterium]|nr:glycosyltransferase [Candidatus Omnitrophota bacterium]
MHEKSTPPQVSIIIPTYNRAELIGRSIKSVLQQSYQDFEIIVIDDGSNDNSGEVISSFNDERIIYLRRAERGGVAKARNEGIIRARGSFIAFQDSDDEWLPEKLEKQIKIFEQATPKLGVVYSNMWKIDKDGKKEQKFAPRIMPEDRIVYKDALRHRLMNIGIVSALINRACFEKVGIFDEKLLRYVDLELLMRVSKYYYFYHLSEPLVKYYITNNSISSDRNALISAEKVILDKYYQDIKKDRKLLSKRLYWIGTLLCQEGQMLQGRKYILQAIKKSPINIKFILVFFVSFAGNKNYRRIITIKNLIICRIEKFNK